MAGGEYSKGRDKKNVLKVSVPDKVKVPERPRRETPRKMDVEQLPFYEEIGYLKRLGLSDGGTVKETPRRAEPEDDRRVKTLLISDESGIAASIEDIFRRVCRTDMIKDSKDWEDILRIVREQKPDAVIIGPLVRGSEAERLPAMIKKQRPETKVIKITKRRSSGSYPRAGTGEQKAAEAPQECDLVLEYETTHSSDSAIRKLFGKES